MKLALSAMTVSGCCLYAYAALRNFDFFFALYIMSYVISAVLVIWSVASIFGQIYSILTSPPRN